MPFESSAQSIDGDTLPRVFHLINCLLHKFEGGFLFDCILKSRRQGVSNPHYGAISEPRLAESSPDCYSVATSGEVAERPKAPHC